ncbi:MAG: hypothetical protein AAF355_02805 [Myxococcota bacterium]
MRKKIALLLASLPLALCAPLVAGCPSSALHAQPLPTRNRDSGPAFDAYEALQSRLDALQEADPPKVAEGVLTSIDYTISVSKRIQSRFSAASGSWKARAARFLYAAERGVDPFQGLRGAIANRGYRSSTSLRLQGYAVYLPEAYDPDKTYPLYLALHGGSSNGNLFLGVVMGHNMDWRDYALHLWDDFAPRWHAPMIVVAPDGFGQPMWRWMAEQEVFEVIEDVKTHYSVDPDRIILAGLSNGGVGTYSIGLRHASRFSAVQAIAGAPSWMQYAGGSPRPAEKQALTMLSGLHLAENSRNTHFEYFHGRSDSGPMRPSFVRAFQGRLDALGVPNRPTWFQAGHDILYFVLRRGEGFERLQQIRRDRRPSEVRLVTADYRASTQHWVTATRLRRYPQLARITARAGSRRIEVRTDNVDAFYLDLAEAPSLSTELALYVDGQKVFSGPRAQAGDRLHLVRKEPSRQGPLTQDPLTQDPLTQEPLQRDLGDEHAPWTTGFPHEQGLEKRPGLSGPITDAYYDRMVHVYGTQKASHLESLKQSATRGARGWPLGLWEFQQEVRADTEVDGALMRSAHLVLYGTAGDNLLLEQMKDRLPITIDEDAIYLGDTRFEGRHLGTRFIYPNPLAPSRYVIIQAGTTLEAVSRGHQLPDFLADWVLYDHRTTRSRPRLIFHRNAPRSTGFFDRHWEIPAPFEHAAR